MAEPHLFAPDGFRGLAPIAPQPEVREPCERLPRRSPRLPPPLRSPLEKRTRSNTRLHSPPQAWLDGGEELYQRADRTTRVARVQAPDGRLYAVKTLTAAFVMAKADTVSGSGGAGVRGRSQLRPPGGMDAPRATAPRLRVDPG